MISLNWYRPRILSSDFRVVQEYTRWSPRQVIAARSRLSIGIGALGATVNHGPMALDGYTASPPGT